MANRTSKTQSESGKRLLILGACLLWAAISPQRLLAQSCSSNTTDPSYNHQCDICQAQEFADVWACNQWGVAGMPSYQACIQNATNRFNACVAALPPAPPPAPQPPPSPAANPCVPVLADLPLAPQSGPSIPLVSLSGGTPCLEAVDPVPIQDGDAALLGPGSLLTGKAITTAPERLARDGRTVSAIVADGAARVVIRIRGDHVGQNLTLTLQDDFGGFSTPQQDGQFANIQGATSGSTLSLKTQSTTQGPMAFAIYLAPNDFNRDNSGLFNHDRQLMSRFVTVKVTSDDNKINLSQPINILRPPIVLVHGIWGNPNTWGQFKLHLAGIASWLPAAVAADYSKPLSGRITSAGTTPAGFPPILANYLPFLLRSARENSLGFQYNAPIVQRSIRDTIRGYRQSASAAASRADVAGHSMGGLVTRWGLRLPEFSDGRSFGKGNIHILATIGTPHFGSPVPNVMFADPCASVGFSAIGSNVLGQGVTLVNPNETQDGAVFDLAGSADGTGKVLSPNLSALASCQNDTVPTALIAGQAGTTNYSGLNIGKVLLIQIANQNGCFSTSLLAATLTQSGWMALFNNQPNDALVAVTSQFASQSATPGRNFTAQNTIHSDALAAIFNGPAELQTSSGIADQVANLFNTPISGNPNVFYQCSAGGYNTAPPAGPPQ